MAGLAALNGRRLTTTRLVGEPPAAAAFELLRAIHGDVRAAATLTVDGLPLAPARTHELLERMQAHWRAHEFGVRLFCHRLDDAFVGYCGLRHHLLDGLAVLELVYAVVSGRWCQGYATEMARATLDDGIDRLGMTAFVAFALPHNLASRGVMTASGFAYDRDIVHAGLPHVLYRRDGTAGP